MSRWRHRLAELRLEAHPQPLGAVQNVQNVQSLSSVRTFEHSGQIEQRTEGDAPRLADWRVLSLVLGRPCPDDLSPERWERSRRGVERFAEGWAVQAMRLGWTFEDLFSIAKPFGRVDLQGAACRRRRNDRGRQRECNSAADGERRDLARLPIGTGMTRRRPPS